MTKTWRGLPARDSPMRLVTRVKTARAQLARERSAIAYWRPSDRPYKTLCAELDAVDECLDEIEEAINDERPVEQSA